MTTISKRLREGRTPGTDLRWRVTDVHIEAADTIDALVAALEASADYSIDDETSDAMREAALAKAKACHTGNSARGNATKDEA